MDEQNEADQPTTDDASVNTDAVGGSNPPGVETGTWTDDGKGLAYPGMTDNYHSGHVEPAPKTDRVSRLIAHLSKHHGIHFKDDE